ncbi:exodeoxyribonuclease 7 small subunit [Methanobrevibacter woesei]|uniref:Exodeoxyribonuclease 7 small subunit n=2 Tax=Methanobrevibacter woesei TaxID=190976 RepID=A0A2U1S9D6_9EURY|nr:exodeoxyribonuclease VII small subunit [Methanobrevibacter woesei]MCC9261038.1 exodeoxyribonuclease VII small subunit [Methanobrevibacter woesei]PWB86967.1 exodeoxyribonuclease 7 small subunit [Methanobrevibacter woesei]
MDKSFEEKLDELESLVKQLESENVPLKEAVELYTQANKLLKECGDELNDTKELIQKISEDGALEEFNG